MNSLIMVIDVFIIVSSILECIMGVVSVGELIADAYENLVRNEQALERGEK